MELSIVIPLLDESESIEELHNWIELNERAEDFPQIVGQIEPLKGPKCSNPDADS